jgi:hypothetical protein
MTPLPAMTSTNDDGSETWQVIEKVAAKDYLPTYNQVHNVLYKQNASASCSCPFYVSGLLLCSGCAAVCAMKGHTDIASLIPLLHPMWLVRNHPLFVSVYPSGLPNISNVRCNSQLSQLSQSSAPNSTADRHAILRNVFDDILTRVTDVTSFGNFHNVLLQHRSNLYNSMSLLMPPKVAITHQQENHGLGSVAEVKNQSNYNRSQSNRKRTAQLKDPTAYSVYKKAAHNESVVCECGETVLNDKHKMYKHRQGACHVAWLAEYRRRNVAGNSQAEVCEANVGHGEEGANAALFGIPNLLMYLLQATRTTMLVMARKVRTLLFSVYLIC